MPKAIAIPDDDFGGHELAFFDDAIWKRIKACIPKRLSAKRNAQLRSAIADWWSWYLTERKRLQYGKVLAEAMRSPDRKDQLAPLARYRKTLKTAVNQGDELVLSKT